MELTYKIEAEDFVAFNLSYIDTSPMMKTQVRNMGLIGAGLALIGGCILMELLGYLNAITVGVYALLAAAIYFLMPHLHRRRVRKSILRLLLRPQNHSVCTEKILTLSEDEITLVGGGENSRYAYSVIERVEQDATHYFIYVGAMAALIVPFRAFPSDEEKTAFFDLLHARVEQFGGRMQA